MEDKFVPFSFTELCLSATIPIFDYIFAKLKRRTILFQNLDFDQKGDIEVHSHTVLG